MFENYNSTRSSQRSGTSRLGTVLDHPASVAAIIDPDGSLLIANDRALELIDAPLSEVEHQPFWNTPWFAHSESLQADIEDAVQQAATGHAVSLEADCCGADGSGPAVDMSFQPITNDGGEVVFIVLETSDVTDRKRIETELRESQVALQDLYRISSNPELSLEKKLRRLLDLGCEYLDLEAGFLSTIDIDDDHFEIVEARGSHERIQSSVTCPLSETYCRRTIEGEGLLGIQDAAVEAWKDDPAHERFELGCYLGAKILVDGSLYGTLCFADGSTREIPFLQAERTFVELIVGWLSQALERREYERDLREANHRLENMLERIDDAFLAVNDEWEFTYLNSRAETILQRSADDLLGANVWEEYPDAADDLFFEELHRALETQAPVSFEEHYDPFDIWVEVNAYPSEDGLSVFFRDITDQKQYETVLTGLLETSRALMRTETKADIADLVIEAVGDILGYRITEIHLYDPETEALVPSAATEATRELMPEPLSYPVGDGLPGEVFEQEEAEWYTDITVVDDYEYGQIRSAMVLPLSGHGTLSIGDSVVDTFDEADVTLATILTTIAEAAFDQAEHEQTLVQYKTVLENVQDMVFVLDEEGRFTFLTQPLADKLGYDRTELEGDPVSVVFEDDAFEKAGSLVEDVFTSSPESTVDFETEVLTVDGERLPVDITLSSLPHEKMYRGVLGVVRDISELAETRTQLEDERDRFTYLFEHLPDPVVDVEFVDEKPLVRSVNPAFTEVFGYEADRVHGDSLNSFIIPSSLDSEAKSIDRRTLQGRLNDREVRRKTASGIRHFLFRGVPYERDGTHGGQYGLGIYTDITEQKERERYLQVINRILRHNLRNDLTVVSGYAEMLAEAVDDPEMAGYASSIQEVANELSELSETARDLERIVGRRDDDGLDAVEVTSRITEVVEEYRASYPDAKIVTDLPDQLHATADERLADVFDQLLEKALTHNDQSPPEVEIRLDTDESSLESADDVSIAVYDNGSGIPERERAVITDDREITQLDHATGIGLWLVKWVMESYGGTLDIGERSGHGSHVTLRFRQPSDT